MLDEIIEIAVQRGDGVKLGQLTIVCIFYADDLVLFEDSLAKLEHLLLVVFKECNLRGLSINFEKNLMRFISHFPKNMSSIKTSSLTTRGLHSYHISSISASSSSRTDPCPFMSKSLKSAASRASGVSARFGADSHVFLNFFKYSRLIRFSFLPSNLDVNCYRFKSSTVCNASRTASSDTCLGSARAFLAPRCNGSLADILFNQDFGKLDFACLFNCCNSGMSVTNHMRSLIKSLCLAISLALGWLNSRSLLSILDLSMMPTKSSNGIGMRHLASAASLMQL